MSDQNTSPSKHTTIRRLVFRTISFLAGAGILFHEVVVTPDSEPILTLIALYLMGVPVADLATHVLGGSSRKTDDESKS